MNDVSCGKIMHAQNRDKIVECNEILPCMAGAASQAGDVDSSRAPGITSGLQGSVNVHRGGCSIVGATVTVHQFCCNLLTRTKENTDAKRLNEGSFSLWSLKLSQ